jgi:RNA polymerase sigma-70 factor, ECF subfamily
MAGTGSPSTPGALDGVSDAELMRSLAAGTREALDPLVRRHHARLYRLVLGYVRNPDDAVEVIQETFVRVCQHAGRWDARSEVAAWLTRIAINQAIDRYRREKRRRAVMTPLDEDAGPVRAIAVGMPQDRLVGSREIGERVGRALEALTERQRAVFLLRHQEEMSLEAIAESLGIHLGTVKSNLHRALQRLRVQLETLR